MNKEQKIKKKGNLSFKSKEREQTYRLPTFLYDWIHFAPRIELWSLTIGMNIEKFIFCFNTKKWEFFCVNRPCSQSIRIDVAFLVVVFVFSKHLFNIIEIAKNEKNSALYVREYLWCREQRHSFLFRVASCCFRVLCRSKARKLCPHDIRFRGKRNEEQVVWFKSRWKNSLAWRYCEV